MIEENGSIERENQQLHRIPGTTKVFLKSTWLFRNNAEKFRDFKVPRQKDLGYGFGQSNIWYAEEEKAERFKNKTINYINELKGNNRLKIIQP